MQRGAAIIIYDMLWKLEKSCQQTLKKHAWLYERLNLSVKANYELQLPTKVEKIFDIFCKHQRRFSFDFLIFAMTIAGMNSNCSLDVILIRPGNSATCSQFSRWTNDYYAMNCTEPNTEN